MMSETWAFLLAFILYFIGSLVILISGMKKAYRLGYLEGVRSVIVEHAHDMLTDELRKRIESNGKDT